MSCHEIFPWGQAELTTDSTFSDILDKELVHKRVAHIGGAMVPDLAFQLQVWMITHWETKLKILANINLIIAL